jgi:hypothetical protein
MKLFLKASVIGAFVFFVLNALVWTVAFRGGDHVMDMIRHTSIMFAPAFLLFGIIIGGVVKLFHARKGFHTTDSSQNSQLKKL